MEFTEEIFDTLEVAELNNLVKKLRDGKTFTSAEASRYEVLKQKFQDREKQFEFVGSLSDLGARLGTTKRQILRWMKLDGAPQKTERGYSVVDWLKFVRERGLVTKVGNSAYDMLALRARKLLTEIETQTLKLEITKGRFVPREDVEEEWLKRAGEMKNKFYLRFTMELPPVLVGKSAIEVQQILQNELDRIFAEA